MDMFGRLFLFLLLLLLLLLFLLLLFLLLPGWTFLKLEVYTPLTD